MEKIWQIIIGLAVFYAAYALSLKKWDYDSAAKREEAKLRLKRAGLSVRYYFIPANRLLVLNALSGGFFFWYWSYKQWQAVTAGYKNAAGGALKYGPLARAVFSFISFYQLTAVVNRTCAYMRKRPALPAVFWGSALAGGFTAACLPCLSPWWRAAGAALYIAAPYALQKRINALPKEPPPSRLKTNEILWVGLGWLVWACVWAAARCLGK